MFIRPILLACALWSSSPAVSDVCTHAGAVSLTFLAPREILQDLGFVLSGCHFARLIDTRGSLNGPGTSPELSQLISVWQE